MLNYIRSTFLINLFIKKNIVTVTERQTNPYMETFRLTLKVLTDVWQLVSPVNAASDGAEGAINGPKKWFNKKKV